MTGWNLPPGVTNAMIEEQAFDHGFERWIDGKTDGDLIDWLVDERDVDPCRILAVKRDPAAFDDLVYDEYLAMIEDGDEDEAASDRERGY